MKLPNKLFVDTSFFIALLNSRDADHSQAVKLQEQLSKQAIQKVTSDYILLELCDGLAKLSYRQIAVQTIELIEKDGSFKIIPTSSEITQAAWTLFKSRPDKEWGLTDCTSFVIMEKFNITSALTTDHHFKQAGFEALLLTR
jgi:predicted nucleic acid-binding protein